MITQTSTRGIVKPEGIDNVEANLTANSAEVSIDLHLNARIAFNRETGEFVITGQAEHISTALLDQLKAEVLTLNESLTF
ncbi:hypothetical protein [Sunxiuqinia indica]|uniref:hypothetical protein n=1 Tax=Sunxiuqinia indica TaxID=2692584 RepID=UPI00135A7747|nr:hypothetical protein [Sunxiuqinia indica]